MPTKYQPGQQIDHYKIVEVLGQGGASSVYLARDQHTQQEVVLKFPHIEDIGSADVFARYQREVKIGKCLSHPGIQRHLNQDEERSAEYLVLEYVCGQTLRTTMKRLAPALLSTGEVVRIMLQVGDALLAAHEQGVIHRDVKPDNILLRENGDVVLFDFGIAQWAGERFLRWRGFSTLIGTPGYMAPELLQAKAGSVQSDIYAMGAMLYELLCGHTPFEEEGFAFLSQHISHDPPDILTHHPALSPQLATVVMRAIRRDPRKRYTSIRDLLHDLEHLEAVTPVAYVPDPPLVGGRYRQALRLALTILVILFCIVAFGLLVQFAHSSAH